MCLTQEQQQFSKKNDIKTWPLNIHDAIYCLQALPYAPDSKYIFIKVDFSIDLTELDFPMELTELKEEMLSWDLITIAKSALFFYLAVNQNGRKRNKLPDYISHDWRYIAPVLLNKHINKDVISLLQLFYFCPNQVKIVGVNAGLRHFSSFSFSRSQISTESLNDLLLFLEIDESSRALLIQKSFKDQNFKQLVDFLKIYERAVNKNLLLTATILFYKKEFKNKKKFIQLQKEINQLFDLARIDLESFEIFDLFESSEQAKSGSSKISFYSFYQDLLLSLILESNEEKDLSIKVFELFELFLYSASDKTIFLIEIGFETGSSIQKFIVDFCKSYSRELQNLCGKDAFKYGVSLTIYVTGLISIYIGILLFIVSRPFGLYKDSRSNSHFSRGQPSNNVASFYNENEDIVKNDQSEDLVIPSTQTEGLRENKKVRRLSNGNFASIMLRFARKGPMGLPSDQGLGQTTFSQSLQSSESIRTDQFVDNKVQQKRVGPTNATLTSSQAQNATPAARIINLKKKPISIKGEILNFEVSTTVEALAMVQSELQKTFPTSNLSIVSVSTEKLIGSVDVSEESTSVTLVGTCVHYSHRKEVKTALSKAVNRCNGLLTIQTPGLIEFDHGVGTLPQRILNLSRNEAHVVALYKPEHRLITDARNNRSLDLSELGYTNNTGGVFELIEILEKDNSNIISNFFEDSKTSDQFLKQGYNLEGLQKAYQHNFAADREKVAERLEEGVSGNIALAIGIDKVYNETLEEDFTRFTRNLGRNPTVSGPEAAAELDISIEKATAIREHTNAIRDYIKQDTRAYANFKTAENGMLATVKQAYEFVEIIGGEVDKTIKQDFVSENPTQFLEEAFEQAVAEDNFNKLIQKPPSVVGPRIFINNYKK